jgi:membrane associated rhomboid family serine protease
MTIINEIKQSYKRGGVLVKLIYINIIIFLVLFPLVRFVPFFYDKFLIYFMVPADLKTLIFRPWTVFTYMFLHFNFLHILFNMIWLYMFGRIFLMFMTEKQLLSTYILGGLAGALLFIISYNIFLLIFNNVIQGLEESVRGSVMLGASAGIMAIGMAVCFYAPDYSVYVFLIGPVKLKYIAIFFIATDILLIIFAANAEGQTEHSTNVGGHIAHLGGALYGYYFVWKYRKGKDIGKGLNSILDYIVTIFKPRKKRMKVSYKRSARDMTDMEYNRSKAETQEEVDRILDKIARSGYDSLTKKEKETLFRMSDKR